MSKTLVIILRMVYVKKREILLLVNLAQQIFPLHHLEYYQSLILYSLKFIFVGFGFQFLE